MPGPSRELQLRLFRDSLSTPWGFRLHGGKDLKLPLTVQKVNLGSPVDGELSRGDVILEIQNCDATMMTHQKAQELIKNSGGSLLLRVQRFVGGPANDHHSKPTVSTGAGSFPGQTGFMMNRIQGTLSQRGIGLSSHDLTSPAGVGNSFTTYDPLPFNHFSQPTSRQFPSAVPGRSDSSSKESQLLDRLYSTLPAKTKSSTTTSQLPTGLQEPGWAPRGLQSSSSTARSRGNYSKWQSSSPRPHTTAIPAPSARPPSLEPERPAWEGSLRSFMNPHLTDMRIIQQDRSSSSSHAAPTEIARFPRTSAGKAQDIGCDRRRQGGATDNDDSRMGLRTLQYNSPLALYSKESANEALHGQAIAKGGTQIRSESESDVYSLLHESIRNRYPTGGINDESSTGNDLRTVNSFSDF